MSELIFYSNKFLLKQTHMDVVKQEDNCTTISTQSRDHPLELLSLVYGYLPYSSSSTEAAPSEFSWDSILGILGFVGDLKNLDVPEPEKKLHDEFFLFNHFR